jgi:hypothetical protein
VAPSVSKSSSSYDATLRTVRAYRQVETRRGGRESYRNLREAYNQGPEAVAFYGFTRTMQSYMAPDGDVVPAQHSGDN